MQADSREFLNVLDAAEPLSEGDCLSSVAWELTRLMLCDREILLRPYFLPIRHRCLLSCRCRLCPSSFLHLLHPKTLPLR
jgi:hypothetical protein